MNNTFAPYYLSPLTISEELHCSICTSPFIDPVTLKAKAKDQQCSHTFCKSCINEWLNKKEETEKSYKCPYCQTEVLKKHSPADKPICNMVNSLQVRCKYYSPSSLVEDPAVQMTEGCNWTGPRSEWNNHLLKECAFREVKCPHKGFGCKWTSKKSLLEDHLRECSYQAVEGVLTRVTSLEDDMGACIEHQDYIEGLLAKVGEGAEEVQKQLTKSFSYVYVHHESAQTRIAYIKKVMGNIVNLLLMFKKKIE